jgi:LPXTG-motif cell wall-anchored protein
VTRDFGIVPADDHTFKARVNFKQDRGGTTNPDVTTPGTTTPDPGSGGSDGTKVLPRTGGSLPALVAVGALLVAGGLLVRCATR